MSVNLLLYRPPNSAAISPNKSLRHFLLFSNKALHFPLRCLRNPLLPNSTLPKAIAFPETPPAMSQVMATRSVHSSPLRPSSGSLQERAEKLKPSRFGSRVLPRGERRSGGAAFRASRITARRTLHAEPKIVPVTPEDVPTVCVEIKSSCSSLLRQI